MSFGSSSRSLARRAFVGGTLSASLLRGSAMSFAPITLSHEVEAQAMRHSADSWPILRTFEAMSEPDIFYSGGIYEVGFSSDGYLIAFSTSVGSEVIVLETQSRKIVSRFPRAGVTGAPTFGFVGQGYDIGTIYKEYSGRPREGAAVAARIDALTGRIINRFLIPSHMSASYADVMQLAVSATGKRGLLRMLRNDSNFELVFLDAIGNGGLSVVDLDFERSASLSSAFHLNETGTLACSFELLFRRRGGATPVHVYDTKTEVPVAKILAQKTKLTAVALSASGRFLATASSVPEAYETASYSVSEPSTIWIWDVERSQVVSSIRGSGAPVGSLSFSPGGDFIAGTRPNRSGSRSMGVSIWRAFDGHEVFSVDSVGVDWAAQVCFSPDGERFAWVEGQSIKILKFLN